MLWGSRTVQIDLIHKGIKTKIIHKLISRNRIGVQIDLIHKGIKTCRAIILVADFGAGYK